MEGLIHYGKIPINMVESFKTFKVMSLVTWETYLTQHSSLSEYSRPHWKQAWNAQRVHYLPFSLPLSFQMCGIPVLVCVGGSEERVQGNKGNLEPL